MKINSAFILDIVYFCTSDGSFRILKKRGPQTFIPAVYQGWDKSANINNEFVLFATHSFTNSVESSIMATFFQ